MRKVINEVLARPLLFTALFCALVLMLILPHTKRYSSDNADYPNTLMITGKVVSKVLDEDGFLKSFTVSSEKEVLCYPKEKSLDSNAVVPDGQITLIGSVNYFQKATNPGQFDTYEYYKRKGFDFYLSDIVIESMKAPKFSFREYMFELKNYCCLVVKRSCPLEYGTINTLLFGEKSELDQTRNDLFREVGLAHFLVISGLHVSIAGGGIYRALRNLCIPRWIAAVFGMIFIILYGFLAGFSTSVFRAVFMFSVRLFADMVKRAYDLLSALSLAFLTSVITDPYVITDLGFIYSYLSVLSIGAFLSYRKIRKTTLLSIPVTLYLALLPVNLYNSYVSTLLSIPLNLLLSFVTVPTILLCVLALLSGMLNLSFPAKFFDFLVALIMRFFDLLAGFCEKLSVFRICGKPMIWQILVYYALLILVVFVFHKILPRALNIMIFFFLLFTIGFVPFTSSEIYFLDVGQGDCFVIRDKQRSCVIIDCGSTNKSDPGENILEPFLLSKGIERISDIYVTHADDDHINGITYLLQNSKNHGIRINRIVMGQNLCDDADEKITKMKELALENQIQVAYISAGFVASYENSSITCLWPQMGSLLSDQNADSLVLWYKKGNFDALFTADTTKETESRLMNLYSFEKMPKLDLLKVAHHGSNGSSDEEYLTMLNPSAAIISCGKNNRYGHPHKETMESLRKLGIKTYRTDFEGCLKLKLLKNGYQVYAKR